MFTFVSISGPFLFGKDMPTILGLRLMNVATTKPVKALGVFHGYAIDLEMIWLEKINKIKSCMEVWKSRDLTYFGKFLIIQSFVLSVIGYEIEMVSNFESIDVSQYLPITFHLSNSECIILCIHLTCFAIKSCMEVWKSRDLTYFGKFLIIKSFVLSVIGYEIEMRGIPVKFEKVPRWILQFY
jgi:hypothetical protein